VFPGHAILSNELHHNLLRQPCECDWLGLSSTLWYRAACFSRCFAFVTLPIDTINSWLADDLVSLFELDPSAAAMVLEAPASRLVSMAAKRVVGGRALYGRMWRCMPADALLGFVCAWWAARAPNARAPSTVPQYAHLRVYGIVGSHISPRERARRSTLTAKASVRGGVAPAGVSWARAVKQRVL
jgi:hypothetical protein